MASFSIPHLHFSSSPFKAHRPKPISSSLSDPYVLQIAEALEDSLSSNSSTNAALQKLRETASQSLISKSWPTSKDEPFRFTDTSFLKKSQISPIRDPHPIEISDSLSENVLVIVDGHVIPFLSRLSDLPPGVRVGSLLEIGDSLNQTVFDSFSGFKDGDLFWDLNGIGAPDIAVIFVPADCKVGKPLHLRFCSMESTEEGSNGPSKLPVSNPRVLIIVEKGGDIGIIEEYTGGDKCYWTNTVMEIVIEEGGKVQHSYVQEQSVNAAHIKWTFVRQGSCSTYELTEISTGGKFDRHNLHIQQLGPDTVTELSAFHLSGSNQIHDLHSKLVLDFPRGYARQLHKCIVSHSSGQAVFDGNIKVNRYAQKTDAGQLTRSLLLSPRGTVNVKPNLQIVADDVKCSHGATVSDLEEEQLFYFQAHGIDIQTARNALVFSFGAEVLKHIPYASLRKRVENSLKELLLTRGALQ